MNISITKTANINVSVISTNNTIPDHLEDDFRDWLMYQASVLGRGRHYEYYVIEDLLEDIEVYFTVTILYHQEA